MNEDRFRIGLKIYGYVGDLETDELEQVSEVVPAARAERLAETLRTAVSELSIPENTDDAQLLRELTDDAVTALRAALAEWEGGEA